MAAEDAGHPPVAEVAGDDMAGVDAGQLPVAEVAGDVMAAVDAGQLPEAEAAGDNVPAVDAGQLPVVRVASDDMAVADAGRPPVARAAGAAGVAQPSADDIRKALARLLLEGYELGKVTIGSLRKLVAQSLGLPADGLDTRSVEVRGLAQLVVGELTGWWTPETTDARGREVYFITFAAVLASSSSAASASRPLRTLGQVSREDIRDAILDVVAQPVGERRPGRPQATPTTVVKMVIFFEIPKHFHVAIRFSKATRFMLYKAGLRDRHGLASHWSPGHTMFWSAVRYGTTATEHKPVVDATPLVWTFNNEPLDLFAESQEPFMASVVRKRREQAAMRPDPVKVAKGANKEQFSKFDLTALVIAEDLKTPAQILHYIQQKGSAMMQAFVNRHQGRLREYIEHAREWSAAGATVQQESESDWSLLQRLADSRCSYEGECAWSQAARSCFQRNAKSIDSDRLAACVAAIVQAGPAKTRRILLLVGPSSAGKSTIFDPVDNVFGDEAVFHTPAMGSPIALANLALKKKRLLYLDDYRPVEYALATDKRPATIPVVTFLKLAGGQRFEVQVSQSFQNGNIDMQWTRGAIMTAKDDGLWCPAGNVTSEDIRHMQSRVEQFRATEQLPSATLRDVPLCKESWASWVVTGSVAFAARSSPPPAPRPEAAPAQAGDASGGSEPVAVNSIHGFAELMSKAVVAPAAADSFLREMIALGVISIQELTPDDWKSLRAWQELLPFAQRRVLAIVK